jgi:hypothetical protein
MSFLKKTDVLALPMSRPDVGGASYCGLKPTNEVRGTGIGTAVAPWTGNTPRCGKRTVISPGCSHRLKEANDPVPYNHVSAPLTGYRSTIWISKPAMADRRPLSLRN